MKRFICKIFSFGNIILFFFVSVFYNSLINKDIIKSFHSYYFSSKPTILYIEEKEKPLVITNDQEKSIPINEKGPQSFTPPILGGIGPIERPNTSSSVDHLTPTKSESLEVLTEKSRDGPSSISLDQILGKLGPPKAETTSLEESKEDLPVLSESKEKQTSDDQFKRLILDRLDKIDSLLENRNKEPICSVEKDPPKDSIESLDPKQSTQTNLESSFPPTPTSEEDTEDIAENKLSNDESIIISQEITTITDDPDKDKFETSEIEQEFTPEIWRNIEESSNNLSTISAKEKEDINTSIEKVEAPKIHHNEASIKEESSFNDQNEIHLEHKWVNFEPKDADLPSLTEEEVVCSTSKEIQQTDTKVSVKEEVWVDLEPENIPPLGPCLVNQHKDLKPNDLSSEPDLDSKPLSQEDHLVESELQNVEVKLQPDQKEELSLQSKEESAAFVKNDKKTNYVEDIDASVFQGIVLESIDRTHGIYLLEPTQPKELTDKINGISVNVDQRKQEVYVHLELSILYGYSIPEKAAEVREKITNKIQSLTGYEVAYVRVKFKNILAVEPVFEPALIENVGCDPCCEKPCCNPCSNPCCDPCVPDPCPPIEVCPPVCEPNPCKELKALFSAGYLYWAAYQEGMAYAISGFGVNPQKGQVYDLCWDWNPGLRLGTGFEVGCKDWDLAGYYTWYQSRSSNEITQGAINGETSINGTWYINNKTHSNLTQAEACWDLYYNNVNVEFGKYLAFCDCFDLKFLLGFQVSWIDQDYTIRYRNSDNEIANSFMDQDYKGFGFRGGFLTTYCLSDTCSLFGQFNFSSLWSKYDINRMDQEISACHPNQILVNTCYNYDTIDPVTSFKFGLKAERCVGKYLRFAFQLSLEYQSWYTHNQYITFSPDHSGDLILQGGLFEFKITF